MSLALFIGGPPYPLDTAQIGGLPSVSVDIPPLAVFLALYATSAMISIILFEHQRRRHFSCTIPVILFLFSGERVLTCVLRMVWAFKLTNVRVAVASQVFSQAGVLLLFLLNLILAERIWLDRKVRARTRLRLRIALITLSTLTVSALIMEIASIIVSVYTLDQKTISTCRNVQRTGATYFLILATTPLAMLALAFLTSPASSTKRQGTSSGELVRFPVTIVSSVLCILNAGFKTGVVWTPPRSLFDPAWYHSRACLYVFGFTAEVCVLILLYATCADVKFPRTTDQGNTNIEHGTTALDDGEIVAPHSKYIS
ncbi:hypothetical protein VP1G_09832 [Cytospora mali]|uniref:Uncharacterized protein n=1 Tax=Cytospora mali TaxID=578113 RepID=A0A194VFD2_CYTMA|nr:hypothetical protein VP1G_09832 [Valsa mali var. pyri (nom. inval.)]